MHHLSRPSPKSKLRSSQVPTSACSSKILSVQSSSMSSKMNTIGQFRLPRSGLIRQTNHRETTSRSCQQSILDRLRYLSRNTEHSMIVLRWYPRLARRLCHVMDSRSLLKRSLSARRRRLKARRRERQSLTRASSRTSRKMVMIKQDKTGKIRNPRWTLKRP